MDPLFARFGNAKNGVEEALGMLVVVAAFVGMWWGLIRLARRAIDGPARRTSGDGRSPSSPPAVEPGGPAPPSNG